jgi:hypothetical protein
LQTWQPGGALPRAEEAEIDPAKFERYSMEPSNRSNRGKQEAFEALGYELHDPSARRRSAEDVIDQLRRRLPSSPAVRARTSEFGERFEVEVPITGPNRRAGSLVTVWQYDAGSSTPRLVSNWLKVHS